MDATPLAGRTSASIRIAGSDWEPAASLPQSQADPTQVSADYIDLKSAVTPPDVLDKLLFQIQNAGDLKESGPSLASLLDAIKQYIHDAVMRAKQEDEAFFHRVEQLADHLTTLRGSERLKAIGELVGATSPELKDAFLKAVGSLAEKVRGGSLDPSKPDSMELRISDLHLSVDSMANNKARVKFDGVHLTLHSAAHSPSMPTAIFVIGKGNT